MYNQLESFSFQNVYDPSTVASFTPANYSPFDSMAYFFDNQFEEYHIPLNFTTATLFTDANCDTVEAYEFDDNGALWTGTAMNGDMHQYIAAIKENNASLEQDALRVIRKLISGMAMEIKVPNGGLGSNYSGIFSRGWAVGDQAIAPIFFTTAFKLANGTGAYSQYRWRGFTSNDEYGGYYMGLALALKYVNDNYVQWTVAQIVDQLCNYMIKTNFFRNPK